MPGKMFTISDLMATLRSVDATAPRLTWYGPDGERVELSGRVLDNWVAKTANFAVDELDAGPGSTVGVDMPAHWRSLCWLLAAWQAGATVVFTAGSGAPAPAAAAADGTDTDETTTDVVVTADPGLPATSMDGSLVVAVALGALDMRWHGDLPGGVIDYAAEVRAHGDVFMPFDQPAMTDTAVVHRAVQGNNNGDGTVTGGSAAAPDPSLNTAPVTFGTLMDGYAVPFGQPERVLLRADAGLEPTVRTALGIWAAGGSVLLVHPSVQIEDRLLASERVTSGR
ncbi:TIGR03089 family protein [Arthrobacter sp. A5]|uniref:TIGR03089 family protein n=1 Tax=Arthrobacter sp. A5 TaxID=576926 RepID=UPI003DA7ABBF